MNWAISSSFYLVKYLTSWISTLPVQLVFVWRIWQQHRALQCGLPHLVMMFLHHVVSGWMLGSIMLHVTADITDPTYTEATSFDLCPQILHSHNCNICVRIYRQTTSPFSIIVHFLAFLKHLGFCAFAGNNMASCRAGSYSYCYL